MAKSGDKIQVLLIEPAQIDNLEPRIGLQVPGQTMQGLAAPMACHFRAASGLAHPRLVSGGGGTMMGSAAGAGAAATTTGLACFGGSTRIVSTFPLK